MNNDERDEALWKIAKRRAMFKRSFSVYVMVNAFLIAVWYFSSGPDSYFWPIWPMIGWGLRHTHAIPCCLPGQQYF